MLHWISILTTPLYVCGSQWSQINRRILVVQIFEHWLFHHMTCQGPKTGVQIRSEYNYTCKIPCYTSQPSPPHPITHPPPPPSTFQPLSPAHHPQPPLPPSPKTHNKKIVSTKPSPPIPSAEIDAWVCANCDIRVYVKVEREGKKKGRMWWGGRVDDR